MPNDSSDPDDPNAYYGNKIRSAVEELCDLIRSLSPEELRNIKWEYEPHEPRWVPLPEGVNYLLEDLHQMIEAHRKSGSSLESCVYDEYGRAEAWDEAGEEWTIECGINRRIQVGWALEIDLTREEIREAAAGRIDGFEMIPCQAKDCPILVRRSVPFCWFHEPDEAPSDP